MEFESILSSIKDTNDACVSLIGEDQRSQIRDLQIMNDSLNNQIRIKDEELQRCKGELDSIDDEIASIIYYLKENAATDSDFEEIEDIESETYAPTQIKRIFQFMSSNAKPKTVKIVEEEEDFNEKDRRSEEKETIERLTYQLEGHINFLTRLVQAPEYQNLFLVSDQTGKTFLDSSTKDLLLEQSRRTTQLLSTLPESNNDNDEFANIDDVLGHKLNLMKRTSTLSNLLNKNNCTEEELKDMLLQETVITSILTKSYKYMQQVAEERKRAQNSPSRYSSERNYSRSPDASDKAYEKQAKSVFRLLNKALNENNSYSKEALLDSAKRIAQDSVGAQESVGNACSFSQYVDETGDAIRELTQRVKEMKENMRNQQKKNNDDVWYPWARRVYAGILGIEAKPKNYKDMQIIIEESALTSCGNRQLQKRLDSLRNQKKFMIQPEIKPKKEVRFKTLLAVSIALMRCQRTPTHVRVSQYY